LVEVINAEGLVLGRLASYAAKKALEGEEVIIVNAEKTIITGNKETVFEKYYQKKNRGDPFKGPFYPRRPDFILRRSIRNMMPYKTLRGRKALKRVKVYVGLPERGLPEPKTFPEMSKEKLKVKKYVTLEQVSEYLGWKKKT